MYIYVYLKCYKNWSSLVIEVNFNKIESIFISNYQVSIEKVVKLYFIDVETWKTIVNLQQKRIIPGAKKGLYEWN